MQGQRKLAGMALGVVLAAGAGCGEKEADVVDRALREEIRSADMELSVRMADHRGRLAAGFTVAGPFVDNGERKLPSFDWRMAAEGAGAPAFRGRVISTGDNVFVRHDGRTYEVGEKQVAAYNAELARSERSGEQVEDLEDVGRLGIDLRD